MQYGRKLPIIRPRPDLCPQLTTSERTIPNLTTSPHFPLFLGQKWKRRSADLGLFRIHPRAPPPAGGFQKPFSLRRIAEPLDLQSDHTDPPCKNFQKFPSAAISLAILFVYESLISSQNGTTKNCQPEQDVYRVFGDD